MNSTLNSKKSRRRRPSAFFAFIKALFRALCILAISFIAELVIAGLLDVWKQALTYWILWIVPGLLACGCFLDGLIRKPKIQFTLWMALFILVCGVQAWIYFTPSDQIGQIRMVKSQSESIDRQRTQPLVDNVALNTDSDVPFYVEIQEGQPLLDPAAQNLLVSYINSLPQILKEKAGAIYFLAPDSFYSIEGCQEDPSITGITQLERAAIYLKDRSDPSGQFVSIAKDGTAISLNNPQVYRDTLVHEFMHLLDVQTEGLHLQRSGSEQWQALFTQYQNVLGDYAATSPEEFFAEAGVYYLYYPEQLQRLAPEVYSYFQNEALKAV